jgi:hypothetical protein
VSLVSSWSVVSKVSRINPALAMEGKILTTIISKVALINSSNLAGLASVHDPFGIVPARSSVTALCIGVLLCSISQRI